MAQGWRRLIAAGVLVVPPVGNLDRTIGAPPAEVDGWDAGPLLISPRLMALRAPTCRCSPPGHPS